MKNTLLFFSFCFIFISCDGNSDDLISKVVGQWERTIPSNNNSQTKELKEILAFNSDGTYSVTIDNRTTNSGTYQQSKITTSEGKSAKAILYTNIREMDSVGCYTLEKKNSIIKFDNRLIGWEGSVIKEYVKK